MINLRAFKEIYLEKFQSKDTKVSTEILPSNLKGRMYFYNGMIWGALLTKHSNSITRHRTIGSTPCQLLTVLAKTIKNVRNKAFRQNLQFTGNIIDNGMLKNIMRKKSDNSRL